MVRFSLKKFICLLILLFVFTPNFSMILNYNFINSGDYTSLERTANGDFDLDLSILPDIDYDLLNELWYDPKIEMLIITPNKTEFINAVKPLMEWKNEIGIKTIILSNFSLYKGDDDAEKIRNMIKTYYETENIQWVLLAGDAENDLIPIREVYNPDTIRYEGVETVGGEAYKPTDFYYADLNGTWDSDGDGNWGESPRDNSYGLDEISWDPEVYVGRFPADNANELEIMVNKTLKYESYPEVGDWMNRMLLAGGISNTKDEIPPDGEDESVLTTYIWQNYVTSEMNFTHLWRSTNYTPPDPKEPLTSTSFKDEINNGYSTVIFAGHGDPYRYADELGTIYTNTYANNIQNTNKLSLIYGDACSTSSYDINDNSIGETLIKKNNAGAIGYISGLRVTWYLLDDYNLEKVNRGNAKLFWEEFFLNKKFQQGKALYDSKVAYMNSDYYTHGMGSTYYDFERKNLLTYCLLGDPSVDIYTNTPKFALNPFTENVYEGQLVSIIIKDTSGRIVPYARVHLKGSDGKFHTAYADENGFACFRVPTQENENYNVTITGHNLYKSTFNFTTLPDNSKPQFIGVECNPINPKTSDITTFNIQASDNKSGIESVYLFLSKNNFINYTYYGLSNNIEENKEILALKTERLTPGKFSYFIVSRDYANNTAISYNSNFVLLIPQPIIDYLVPVSFVVIIGIVGISVFIIYKGLKKYQHILNEF